MTKIGIDPDISRSGVAVKVGNDNKGIKLSLQKYFQLFDFLKGCDVADTVVFIEAGWLNEKSNFHNWKGQSKNVAERISKNVGANHEAGRKIVEMCDYLGLQYKLIRPSHGKMKPEIFEKITGIKTRNQEKIDAANLVF